MTRHFAHSLERIVGGSSYREGRYHFVRYRLRHRRRIVLRRSFTRGMRRWQQQVQKMATLNFL